MTKASDNAFPSILVTEGTEPSAPAAGKQRLYIDSTSHHLSRTNSSGTEVDLETNQAASTVAAHGCRAIRASGNFSVGNNTLTAVQFDGTDSYDTDSIHNPSSSNTRMVIPSISGVTTSLWSIKASGYADATSGRVDCVFRKNAAGNPASGTLLGGNLGPTAASGTLGDGYTATVDAVLSAGDYVECFVRTTGGSFSVVYDAEFSPLFEVAFLGKVT